MSNTAAATYEPWSPAAHTAPPGYVRTTMDCVREGGTFIWTDARDGKEWHFRRFYRGFRKQKGPGTMLRPVLPGESVFAVPGDVIRPWLPKE